MNEQLEEVPLLKNSGLRKQQNLIYDEDEIYIWDTMWYESKERSGLSEN